ncbi:MAG: DUF1801 domain-containing protein [Thaumarchaeota archaeon]|nr:DUF1801 domain-containing protein [Nitrososphaerota archaeon]
MTKKLVTADSARVDTYIAKCPKNVQANLKDIRAAIRKAAPDANETTSYFAMPGYYYPGYDYNGMFAWFGQQKSHISLMLRPPTIQNFQKELAAYDTTKAAVHFPLEAKIPVTLVKKLVRASLKIMKEKKLKRPAL